MFGERLRQLRKEKEMTLRELSTELDLPFTTIGNYERGDREPSFETLATIARYFNVSIDYLVGNEDRRSFNPSIIRIGFDGLDMMLKNASPEAEKLVANIYNNLYLITTHALGYDDEGLQSSSENIEVLQHLEKINYFITNMQFGFSHKTPKGQSPNTKYEFAKKYLKEKETVDMHFNSLMEKYGDSMFDS